MELCLKAMRIASSKVRSFFDNTTGERAALRFLKANPELLFWSFFSLGGHMEYIVPEFGLGKELVCDFILLQSYSAGWKIVFVECEPVDDRVFNKDRTPSKRLRIAQKQIGDWQRYADVDGTSLRIQMADACKKKDIWQRPRRKSDPSSFSGMKLQDPKTTIQFEYAIVIGLDTEGYSGMNVLNTVDVRGADGYRLWAHQCQISAVAVESKPTFSSWAKTPATNASRRSAGTSKPSAKRFTHT